MIPGLCSAVYTRATKGSFSAVAAPPNVSGTDTAGTVTSGTTTVTAVGGTPGYTYHWFYQSGDSGVVATNSTAATTAFSKSMLAGDYTTAVFYCAVTDSGARVVNSNLVYISLNALAH